MNSTTSAYISLAGKAVTYEIDRSRRARYVRLQIAQGRGLVVTVPHYIPDVIARRFIVEKQAWILKHLRLMEHRKNIQKLSVTQEEYEKEKAYAQSHMKERVDFFNTLYKFSYNKITIRNQTSLWGSCTRTGNLQFNYKLMKLSQEVRDYVVVHELCHVKEHNHSAKFWALVAKVFPHYKTLRRELRGYALS